MDSPADPSGLSWLAVRDEVNGVLEGVDRATMGAAVVQFAERHRRWFAHGQGRSGLVAQMAAMRLMHVGFETHVVGEATAPSIAAGDGLLVVSGSGETAATLHLAAVAVEAGAGLLAVTTRADSTLGEMADAVLVVGVPGSRQFGGSLFEQAALLLLDALILDLTSGDPKAYEVMQGRHANLQ